MKLSIIIVSYNTSGLLEACLDSIATSVEGSDYLKNQLEIFVVDNNSIDGSVIMLERKKRAFSIPLTILANRSNVGFARANNQAILQATGSYVLLLNSDTIVQSGVLEKLVQTLELKSSAKIAILSPLLNNPDGSAQPHGGDLPTLSSLFVFAFLLDDIPGIGPLLPSHQHTGKRASNSTDTSVVESGWVGGTAMLIRSEVVPQIGVLDEEIFMYAEDLEYCWRARKMGWDVAIDQSATIEHLGSSSSSPEKALEGELRSLPLVLKKHLSGWKIPFALLLLKVAIFNRYLLFSLLKNTKKAQLYRSLL